MRDQDQPESAAQSRLMRAHDFAQAAPDTIPDDGAADPLRRDKADAKLFLVLVRQNAEQEQAASLRFPLVLNAGELNWQR